MEPERVDRVPHTEINSTLPGSSADVNTTQCSAKDGGADKGAESDLAGMGRVLQASPHSNALPQARRLDCASHMVAPFPPVADPGLDTVAQGEAVRGVWLGEPYLSNTFARFSLSYPSIFVKAVCRKSARTVWAADGGQRASAPPPTRLGSAFLGFSPSRQDAKGTQRKKEARVANG